MTKSHVTERRLVNGRLAWYRSDSDQDFWEKNWQANLNKAYYAPYINAQLGDFEKIFPRFLPKKGKIIEAGCGLAQYVVSMRERGYDVEGYDLAKETVSGVKKIFPELPIHVGDVTHLPVPDNYYDGYISLGVIEHLESGPEPFLQEANRVLKENGIAIITVPHFHFLRRIKALCGAYKETNSDLPFYQYAFKRGELNKLLESSGFEITYSSSMNGLKGIRDEWHIFRKWFDNLENTFLKRAIGKVARTIPFIEKSCGHMLIVVAKKNNG